MLDRVFERNLYTKDIVKTNLLADSMARNIGLVGAVKAGE